MFGILRESKVDDKFPPRLAVDRAWTIYLAAHANVDAADHRRCTLERYLRDRWNAGENVRADVLGSFVFMAARTGQLVKRS